jgi:1A family penicillin-binding protein
MTSNLLKNTFGRLKPRKISWSKVKTWALRAGLGFLLLILLLFAWFAKDLPTPGKIQHRQSASATQIFDRNGKELYAIHGDVKRITIQTSEIPEPVRQATLAAEDRSFYRHFGIDIKGILRAIYYDLTQHRSLAGGSTITQQFVKNALLTQQKTFTRKIKEAFLSVEIEIMYSKSDILTMYLNEIPYGSNAYGIEAASETFLGKKAKDLTLAESATLAALPQSPTYYSPYGIHPDKRLYRTDWVLDSMVLQGYITQPQADAAKIEAKNIKFVERHEQISAPHFVMYVKDLLAEKYGEQVLEEGGLKVYTTLDGDLQQKAEEAIDNAKLGGINASNASMVSLDPKTGQVLAMVGSRDFFNQEIDGQVNVAISERQPGSAFKPVVYATAFKKQYSPGYTLWDVTTDFGNYTPKNYDGSTHGPVTMRKALAGSLNIPAVKTLYLAGMDNVLDQAHSMGITTLNDPSRYGLSLVLGGGEVKLLDLTTAYGVFANQGTLAPTTPILKIIDGKGKTLEEFKEDKKDVLDPSIAYEISNVLSDNNARSYVFGSNSALNFSDRPVAVKTGTTSLYKDAWTVGYTPSLVTGVWVGNNDGRPMTAGAAGAMAAAPIWHDFMAKALGGTAAEQFSRPSDITDGTIDRYTNKLPGGGETTKDIFTQWQLPKDRSGSVGKLRIDKYSGKLATDDCPAQYVEEKTFMDIHSEQPDNPAWENPVRNYLASLGMLTDAPPKGDKTCVALTNKTTINITSPSDEELVAGDFIILADVSSQVPIASVEFEFDGNSLGKDTSSPYSMPVDGNTYIAGKHKITVIATDVSGVSASTSININVASGDSAAPGPATSISIVPGATSLALSWKNPADLDLDKVNVYYSTTAGNLGTLYGSPNANHDSTTNFTINGLTGKKTYYITLRPVDSSGNENNNITQYLGTTL